jgi:hypothetical protein
MTLAIAMFGFMEGSNEEHADDDMTDGAGVQDFALHSDRNQERCRHGLVSSLAT